MPQTNNVHAM